MTDTGPTAIEGFFASGRVVDLILAFMVVEAVILALYYRRTGRGIAPADLAVTLAAGSPLLLALRFALTGADRAWIGACLLASLAAHLADLYRRSRF